MIKSLKNQLLRILLFAVLLVPAQACAQQFRVKVVSIADGDTFTAINRDNLKLRFRLYGIDAPEKKQAFSNVSKQALSNMIKGKTVIVNVKSTDSWGRPVVVVTTQTIKVVGANMIALGMAWHFTRYDQSPHYKALEKKARESKIGLWRDPKPIAPWEYRSKK